MKNLKEIVIFTRFLPSSLGREGRFVEGKLGVSYKAGGLAICEQN